MSGSNGLMNSKRFTIVVAIELVLSYVLVLYIDINDVDDADYSSRTDSGIYQR